MRVAVGIEHTDDLLEDFAQALAAVRDPNPLSGPSPDPASSTSSTEHRPACSQPAPLAGRHAWPPGTPLPPAHAVMKCNANGAPLAGTGVPLPPGVPPPKSGGADVPPGAALLGGSVLGCLLSDQTGSVAIRKTRTPE